MQGPELSPEPLPQEKVQQQPEKEQPDALDDTFLDLELRVRTSPWRTLPSLWITSSKIPACTRLSRNWWRSSA
eukprot:2995548-Prorocentrum_lima.AAC.1